MNQPLGAWWLFPIGLGVSVFFLLSGGLRSFGYAVAVTLVVAALARLVIPESHAGGLIVRSRMLDIGLLLAFAIATAILSASLVIR